MKEFWNERYGNEDFAYGVEPNTFLESQLPLFEKGSILFPAEGEGRNAIFAAKQGWQVSAFDLSLEGKKKADLLAKNNQVRIDYQVGEFDEINYKSEQFDAIALIYAHFSAETKSEYHQKLSTYLKKGGVVIFEAFSKSHLKYNTTNPAVGGPKDLGMLFSLEEIKADFSNFKIILLEETDVDLNEGSFHNGTGSVIRFVGKKM
ncbi:MAG: class I SAM-dependent methyltransferase [Leadbetterella sp.]